MSPFVKWFILIMLPVIIESHRCDESFSQGRPCQIIAHTIGDWDVWSHDYPWRFTLTDYRRRYSRSVFFEKCRDLDLYLPEVWSESDEDFLLTQIDPDSRENGFFLSALYRNGQWVEPRLDYQVNDYLQSQNIQNPRNGRCLYFHQAINRLNGSEITTRYYSPTKCTRELIQGICVDFIDPPAKSQEITILSITLAIVILLLIFCLMWIAYINNLASELPAFFSGDHTFVLWMVKKPLTWFGHQASSATQQV